MPDAVTAAFLRRPNLLERSLAAEWSVPDKCRVHLHGLWVYRECSGPGLGPPAQLATLSDQPGRRTGSQGTRDLIADARSAKVGQIYVVITTLFLLTLRALGRSVLSCLPLNHAEWRSPPDPWGFYSGWRTASSSPRATWYRSRNRSRNRRDSRSVPPHSLSQFSPSGVST